MPCGGMPCGGVTGVRLAFHGRGHNSSVILLQAGWINILSRVGFPFEVSPTLLRLCHAVTMDGLRDMHTYIHMCKYVCIYIEMHTQTKDDTNYDA